MNSNKQIWQLLHLKKSHVSHHIIVIITCAQNVLLQHECKLQTLTLLANIRLNNCILQCSVATVLK